MTSQIKSEKKIVYSFIDLSLQCNVQTYKFKSALKKSENIKLRISKA